MSEKEKHDFALRLPFRDQQIYYCTKRIAKLLGQNKLNEAFNLLDELIEQAHLTEHLGELAIIKARFCRAEKAISLGSISWNDYQVDSSNVVSNTVTFARDLCNYLNTTDSALFYENSFIGGFNFENDENKIINTESTGVKFLGIIFSIVSAAGALVYISNGRFTSLISSNSANISDDIYSFISVIFIAFAAAIGFGIGSAIFVIVSAIIHSPFYLYKDFKKTSAIRRVENSFKTLVAEVNALESKEPSTK